LPTFSGKGYVARLNFDKLTASKVEAGKRGLALAAAELVGILKRDLSKPGPLPPKKELEGKRRKRREELIAASGETARPSAPGEPPRFRLGTLRESVGSEAVKGGMVQRVGTTEKYGFWLEYGTVKMQPRPWLRPGLRNNQARLAEIVTKTVAAG
jgi:hypothetical protein